MINTKCLLFRHHFIQVYCLYCVYLFLILWSPLVGNCNCFFLISIIAWKTITNIVRAHCFFYCKKQFELNKTYISTFLLKQLTVIGQDWWKTDVLSIIRSDQYYLININEGINFQLFRTVITALTDFDQSLIFKHSDLMDYNMSTLAKNKPSLKQTCLL